MAIRYLSLCSGIEAATVAWEPLGWEAVAYSEIEPFPSAVLAHHYPDVPNLGDMTKIDGTKLKGKVDLIVGGTPCQSFSVAGLRTGMADPRGNLALSFLRLVDEIRPRFFIWENVPGVLSSSGGRDFGSFVGAVAQLGYRGAWRVLDAQYFGLAQRRKRVFFVGCSPESGVDPAQILFERDSLRGDSPPSREAGQGAASVLKIHAGCEGGGKGALVGEDQSFTLATGGDQTLFAPTLAVRTANTSANGHGIAEGVAHTLDQAQGQAVAFNARQDPDVSGDLSGPMDANGHTQAVAFVQNSRDEVRLIGGDGSHVGALAAEAGMNQQSYIALPSAAFYAGQGAAAGSIAYTEEGAPTLKSTDSGTNRTPTLHQGYTVRRLTPTECERLQGFPDGYTRIPWRGKAPEDCPDGPRYKALGNSMAVPVMRWIGERCADQA